MKPLLTQYYALVILLLCTIGVNAKTPPLLPAPPMLPEVKVAKLSPVCPCSKDGVCPCTPENHCGCLSETYPVQYRWVKTDNPDQVALYAGKKQLGNWWFAANKYKRMVEVGNDYYWVKDDCPVEKPTRPVEVVTTRYQPPVQSAPMQVYQPQPVYYQPQLQPSYYQPSFNVPVFRGNGGGFRFRGSVGGNCGPSG
jgi:hypothetical protein